MPVHSEAKYAVTPLRQAQRELTRSRIRDAARKLFFALHFDATTMDQIANAAGLRRSTLYLHYKDKSEILSDIAADYAPRAVSLMERLPGPDPTVAQLESWLDGVVAFVVEEKVSLSILLEIDQERPTSRPLEELVHDLLAALGRQVPAFRRAANGQQIEPLIWAKGVNLINMMTFACRYAAAGDNPGTAKALRQVVAEYFREFIMAHGSQPSENSPAIMATV
jgi:AcrR family transcriptional regulator